MLVTLFTAVLPFFILEKSFLETENYTLIKNIYLFKLPKDKLIPFPRSSKSIKILLSRKRNPPTIRFIKG